MTAQTSDQSEPTSKPKAYRWFALFLFNIALIAAAQIFEVLEAPATLVLFALNMGLLVPANKAMSARQEQAGAMSPAIRSYNRRMLVSGFVYMLAMVAAGNLSNHVPQGSPLLWPLALVPLAPIMGMIWAMYRYLREEDDEYLRFQAITRALIGLAVVLVVATTWGFLEMFGLVPHVWVWAVFPIWALGMGLGMCFVRSQGDEQ